MGSIAEYNNTVLLCCNHFYQPCSSFVPSSSSGCLIARAKDGLRGRMKKLEDEEEGRGRGRFMGGNEKSSRTKDEDEDDLWGKWNYDLRVWESLESKRATRRVNIDTIRASISLPGRMRSADT